MMWIGRLRTSVTGTLHEPEIGEQAAVLAGLLMQLPDDQIT
jgi:hypothetical protein